MTMLASQITSLMVVYSILYSGVNQRKHQSSASLAFVREIHRGPVNFPHKWPVTRKMFPFDDVIMVLSFVMIWLVNSLRPGDAYIFQWTGSSLAQVLDSCLFDTNPLVEEAPLYPYKVIRRISCRISHRISSSQLILWLHEPNFRCIMDCGIMTYIWWSVIALWSLTET